MPLKSLAEFLAEVADLEKERDRFRAIVLMYGKAIALRENVRKIGRMRQDMTLSDVEIFALTEYEKSLKS